MNTPWEVVWTEPAVDGVNRLDNRLIDRVVDAVDRYATMGTGSVRRLQGVEPPEWRLRVGDWRVRFFFAMAAHTIVVLHVLPRGRAYRD